MDEKIFDLIIALIPILGTILTTVIVPYIREKIGNEKLKKYAEWATQAVQSAEMIYKGQGMGEAKKEYVVNFLDKMFNKKKVVLTKEQLNVLVESAVKAMKISESK